MNITATHSFIILIVVIVLGILAFRYFNTALPSEHTALAQCIAGSGATFYGAFWCPACEQQKALFGNAQSLLPYVECSTPNGQSQRLECRDAGVTSYPTWVFNDGRQVTGIQTRAELAAAASCALPS